MKIFYKRKQMMGFALSAAIVSNSLVVGNATEVGISINNENMGADDEVFENQVDGYEEPMQMMMQRAISTGDTYKVVVDSLNVRSGPSTSHSTIGSLKRGATVEVQSISNNWAKIKYNGKTAYCSANSKYLEKVLTKMKVMVDSLNVRSGPSTSHSTIGSLKKGATVEVYSISNNWAKIKYNGKTAYCSANSKYLEKITTTSSNTNANTSANATTTTTVGTASVTADVNLRQSASWSGAKIMVVKKGATVEVVSKGSEWTKVKYSGKTGYIPTNYVGTVKPNNSTNNNANNNTNNSTNNTTQTTVRVSVTEDVNLRESASWSGAKIMVIKKGSVVEVVSKGSEWTKVKYNGKTGYISTKYVGSQVVNENMVTIKDATWLRKTESWSAEKIVLLQKGEQAEYISRSAEWIKVKYNGNVGYLTADYVLNVPENNTNNNTNVETTKQYKVTADALNVRSGPSTSHTKIGSITEGKIIEVYSITSGWAKIKYNSTIGYVSADYITVYNGSSSSTSGVGKKVYLDPGHGGTDAGAIGTTYGTKEKDVALDVTKRVASKLRDKGYTVSESRTTDVYPSLSQRSNDANSKGVDIFVSMHFNSASSSSASGLETLYKVDGRTSNVLADKIQDEMIESTGLKDRGLKQRSDLSVLNRTKMAAVLVEGGFLSNSTEENLIKSPSYRETLANAIVEGIEEYFSVMK